MKITETIIDIALPVFGIVIGIGLLLLSFNINNFIYCTPCEGLDIINPMCWIAYYACSTQQTLLYYLLLGLALLCIFAAIISYIFAFLRKRKGNN